MTPSPPFARVSVVIPNHNYGSYVGHAIDSALGLRWPQVEVIVVDDGSTDDSREVISRYEGRVRAVFQEQSGPRVACNKGFALSTGDVVIFLDSDDVLEADLPSRVARVWRPGVSKVQAPMQPIDARGKPSGRPFPRWRTTPSPEQLREWLLETSAYPTPPGSGNVYARAFLEQIMPLDGRCGDATDSACLAAAPLLGDVVSVDHPLTRYRRHQSNRSKMRDPHAFRRHLERAHQRQRFVLELTGERGVDDTSVISTLFRSRHLLHLRVALSRLDRQRPTSLPGDSVGRMLLDSLWIWRAPGPEGVKARAAASMWALTVLAVPRALASRLIARRFG